MKQKAPEELEELLRERSEQYLLYPSDTVWSNINKELHPNRSWIYVSIIVLLFLGGTTAVMLKNQEKASWVNDRSLITMRPLIVPTPSEKLALNTLNEPEPDPVKEINRKSELGKYEMSSLITPLKSVMIRDEEITKKALLIGLFRNVLRSGSLNSELSTMLLLPLATFCLCPRRFSASV